MAKLDDGLFGRSEIRPDHAKPEEMKGLCVMSTCLMDEETDFVDYFARTTGVSEEQLRRVAGVPKCLAVIDAFVTKPMRLATALFHVGDEFDRLQLPQAGGGAGLRRRKKQYPFGYVALIKQMARRTELDASDPRSFKVGTEIKREFREMYEFSPMSELDFQVWLNRDAPFESYDRELEEGWQSLKRRDESEYLWYWQVAHGEILQALYCNRRFLAGLEASYKRRSSGDPSDIYAMLDELVARELSGLPIRLRFRLYSHLAARLAAGLMRIPAGLRAEFPEYYEGEDEG